MNREELIEKRRELIEKAFWASVSYKKKLKRELKEIEKKINESN
jgi:hypothetical protein